MPLDLGIEMAITMTLRWAPDLVGEEYPVYHSEVKVCRDDSGVVWEDVAEVAAVLVPLHRGDWIGDRLDGQSEELSIYGPLFMRDRLVRPFGRGRRSPESVLIVDTLEIRPAWRGLGLGPVIFGEVVKRLSAGVRVVFIKPAPMWMRVPPASRQDWDTAVDKLGRLWAQLGFERLDDDLWATLGYQPHDHRLWVLHLDLDEFEETVSDLEKVVHERVAERGLPVPT